MCFIEEEWKNKAVTVIDVENIRGTVVLQGNSDGVEGQTKSVWIYRDKRFTAESELLEG